MSALRPTAAEWLTSLNRRLGPEATVRMEPLGPHQAIDEKKLFNLGAQARRSVVSALDLVA